MCTVLIDTVQYANKIKTSFSVKLFNCFTVRARFVDLITVDNLPEIMLHAIFFIRTSKFHLRLIKRLSTAFL